MRSGKLDRTIDIMVLGTVDDGYGGQVPGDPETFATVRAQVIQASTTEFMRDYGVAADTVIVFRIRYLGGITTDNWIGYQNQEFDIVELKEIGRRRGLEFRCKART